MDRTHERPKLGPGAPIRRRELVTIGGEIVRIPDPERVVHLQFRRFAGCPVCNLHLRSFVQRNDEIVAAGVREIVVFHSTVEALREHEGDLPFAVVADPAKRLYREFGVESSRRALLHPRVVVPILRAVGASLVEIVRGRRPIPPINPAGGRFGLPADFLITSDGRVCACKYGEHADDQWTVDELLQRVQWTCGHRAARPPAQLRRAEA